MAEVLPRDIKDIYTNQYRKPANRALDAIKI
jgi:hypothetical protein